MILKWIWKKQCQIMWNGLRSGPAVVKMGLPNDRGISWPSWTDVNCSVRSIFHQVILIAHSVSSIELVSLVFVKVVAKFRSLKLCRLQIIQKADKVCVLQQPRSDCTIATSPYVPQARIINMATLPDPLMCSMFNEDLLVSFSHRNILDPEMGHQEGRPPLHFLLNKPLEFFRSD
jgi:hypothetical protein